MNNNSNEKNETESTILKVSINKYPKKLNHNFCYTILLIGLIISICIYISSIYFIYKKMNNNFQSLLQEKNNIINNLKKQLININPNSTKSEADEEVKTNRKLEFMEREFLYDKSFNNPNKMYGAKDIKSNGNSYNIDYEKFIKSRHSTRNYKNMPLKIEDIKKAINMAKYSASECNRQYIKLHYYPKGKMKRNVINYSLGKGGLYLKGVNTFIITFDTNGLADKGERNQRYFNAGLFSTNFVNALHSLGIGTCFIQFANSVSDEEKLKNLNGIPSNEKIAVILYAGYYDEKSIFCVSPRKDFKEYFTIHE